MIDVCIDLPLKGMLKEARNLLISRVHSNSWFTSVNLASNSEECGSCYFWQTDKREMDITDNQCWWLSLSVFIV